MVGQKKSASRANTQRCLNHTLCPTPTALSDSCPAPSQWMSSICQPANEKRLRHQVKAVERPRSFAFFVMSYVEAVPNRPLLAEEEQPEKSLSPSAAAGLSLVAGNPRAVYKVGSSGRAADRPRGGIWTPAQFSQVYLERCETSCPWNPLPP